MRGNRMIEPHESWRIQDATKIQCFMNCPRQYFYQYVLGWIGEAPNVHLEFGTAWHKAMEHLILHGYGSASISEALDKLTTHYRKFFSEQMDEVHHPKTPAMALIGLVKYAQEYADEKFEPIYTEIAGTVPVSGDQVLHFRMDSILRTPDGIKSREHKTAGALSRQWIDQWSLKMQTGVYNHVLYCLYSEEEVWGVEINGAIFSKKEVKFSRVPARRSKKMMQVWHDGTLYWLRQIDSEFDKLLLERKGEGATMRAFPQNTENCTKYFGCTYFDFCIAWANPLQYIDEVPMGFKVKYWNPAEEEVTAKHVFHLKEGGVV